METFRDPETGQYMIWTQDGVRSVTDADYAGASAQQASGDADQIKRYLDAGYKEWTPAQVAAYKANSGSQLGINGEAWSASNPFAGDYEHGGLYSVGDRYFGGPAQFRMGDEVQGLHGFDRFAYGLTQALTAAGVVVGAGAAATGAGAAGTAGAAEGGAATGAGIDASTGAYAGETAASGSAGTGAYGGGAAAGGAGGTGTVSGEMAGASGAGGGSGGTSMPAATAEADSLGGYNIDPETGDVFHGTGDNPFGSNFNGGTGNEFFNGVDQVTPSMLQQAQAMAKQFGITPASALGFLKNALVKGAPAALGAIGANQQRQSLEALAQQYMGLGAPSRARYEASFAPGFTMQNDPGYMDALNQTSKASMHALSVNGNPAGSPNAWGRSMQDLYEKTAYPAIQNFRNTNANAGGIATLQTAAPGAATGAINAQGNVFNAIGAGANDIFNPQPSLAQTLAEYQRLIKSQGSGAVQ